MSLSRRHFAENTTSPKHHHHQLQGKLSQQEVYQKIASDIKENVAFGHHDSKGPDGEKDVVTLYRPKHLQIKLEPISVKEHSNTKLNFTISNKGNPHAGGHGVRAQGCH